MTIKKWKVINNIQTSIKIIRYLESLPIYKYSQKQLSYKKNIKYSKHTKKQNINVMINNRIHIYIYIERDREEKNRKK